MFNSAYTSIVARVSAAILLIGAIADLSSVSLAKERTFPSLNHLPAGELLLGHKAIVPQGSKLRPVYPPGITLTKQSEGWVPYLYNDAAKYCTIGYGHLIKRAPCDGTEPEQFRKGLTEPEGTRWLVRDMATAQYAVMNSVRIPITDGQFGALTDFVFNVGSANFRSSTLLRAVNDKHEERVAAQFRRWVLAGGKVWPGLVTRREREVALYFHGRPTPKGLPPQGDRTSLLDIRRGE